MGWTRKGKETLYDDGVGLQEGDEGFTRGFTTGTSANEDDSRKMGEEKRNRDVYHGYIERVIRQPYTERDGGTFEED